MRKRKKRTKPKPKCAKRSKRRRPAKNPALKAQMERDREELAGTAHRETLAWLVSSDVALPMGAKGRGVMHMALRLESTTNAGMESDAYGIAIYKRQMVAMMQSRDKEERFRGVRTWQSAERLRNSALSKKIDLLLGLMEEEGGVLSSEAEGRQLEGDTAEAAADKLEQEYDDAKQQREALGADDPNPDPDPGIGQQ